MVDFKKLNAYSTTRRLIERIDKKIKNLESVQSELEEEADNIVNDIEWDSVQSQIDWIEKFDAELAAIKIELVKIQRLIKEIGGK